MSEQYLRGKEIELIFPETTIVCYNNFINFLVSWLNELSKQHDVLKMKCWCSFSKLKHKKVVKEHNLVSKHCLFNMFYSK